MWNTNKQNVSKYLLSTALIVGLTTLSIQAWNGLTASPWDKLDYQKWNELVASIQSGIPSGAVMAFNLSTCPTGWSAYNDAIWRTIIWVWNGAGSNTTLTQNVWSITSPWYSFTIPATPSNLSVTANIPLKWEVGDTATPNWITYLGVLKNWLGFLNLYSNTAPIDNTNYLPVNVTISWWWVPSQNITIPGSENNMQPSIALLYCVKN